ncbi:MAG: LamG-like jellyroll fold domain-containing protein, partial [Chloroflexota bacterium]
MRAIRMRWDRRRWQSLQLVLVLVVGLIMPMAPGFRAFAATGFGLQFNGTNQYVTFGKALGLGAATFTLEVWFRREGPGATTSTGTGGVDAVPLVTKGRGEDDGSNVDANYFLGIRGSDGVLAADFEEGAAGSSPGLNHPIVGVTPIALNTWYHAAATYDGTKWQLFLNGVLERELVVGRPPRSDSIQHAALATAMNSLGQPAGYFNGTLDEARIWSYARSTAQIQSTMNQELSGGAPGLIGRWGLNEGAGTSIGDSGSSGSTGTAVNGPVWTGGYPFPPPTVDTTPPAAPQNLSASAAINGSVTLTWNANSEPDLAGYSVYRSTTSPVSTAGPALNPSLLIGTGYTDTTVTNGTPYYYVVAAFDTSNNRSNASNQVSATPRATTLNALRFNGSNQYVAFGKALGLDAATFTLELWFRREGSGQSTSTGTGGLDAVPLLTKGRSEADGSNVDANYFLGIRGSDGVL